MVVLVEEGIGDWWDYCEFDLGDYDWGMFVGGEWQQCGGDEGDVGGYYCFGFQLVCCDLVVGIGQCLGCVDVDEEFRL